VYKRDFKFDNPFARNSRALQEVLQQRSLSARSKVEGKIRGALDGQSDEETVITSVVEACSIKIPQFDFTPEHIKKEEWYDQIPGQLQSIFPNQKMQVWGVTFGFPYTGDVDYLRYIPRAGSGTSFPVFTHDGECFWFKTWTPDGPNRDIEKIKSEKLGAIAFLQKRVADATPELEEYNHQLPLAVRAYFESLKQKYQKDRDILAQL